MAVRDIVPLNLALKLLAAYDPFGVERGAGRVTSS